MESYNFLKRELKLIDVQFDFLSKKITEKNIIEHSKKFLDFKCKKKKYNEKIFLSSFIITAFPHIVLNDVNAEIDKQLFVYSSNLINNFLILDHNFEKILQDFIEYFNFWKKIDLKYITENVAESLFMIGEIKDKLNSDEEDLTAAITKFRADEAEHRQTALDAGAEDAPGYDVMSRIIRLGCKAAIRVSERL